MKPNKSTKLLKVVGLLLANLAALGLVITFTSWLFTRQTEITNQTQALKDLSQKKANLEVLKHSAQTLETLGPKVAAYFIDTDSFNLVIETLEATARQAAVNFRFESVSPSSVAERPALALQFSATGSFADLGRFLLLFENLPFKLVINQASWQVTSIDKLPQWGLEVSAVLLSFKP